VISDAQHKRFVAKGKPAEEKTGNGAKIHAKSRANFYTESRQKRFSTRLHEPFLFPGSRKGGRLAALYV
jgi:hypothetical protein